MQKQLRYLLLTFLCYAIFIMGISLTVVKSRETILPLLLGSVPLIFLLLWQQKQAQSKAIGVRIVNRSGLELPAYATEASAGMDLRACLPEDLVIPSGEKAFVPTGLSIELPVGYEAQIRPRSGLAAKNAITVLNSPGTIDADYRGEIKVILVNHSKEAFTVRHGDRIAQMVVARHEQVRWYPADKLSDTERGEGGFGHTGKH